MKKFYLIFTAIFLSSTLGAQIINFPDGNFKAKLLAASSSNQIAYFQGSGYGPIDTNGNGEIEVNEAEVVTYLTVSNSNISDLTGISFFSGLSELDCSNNLLTTIDLGSLNFGSLKCNNNLLTVLDLSNMSNLIQLIASHNNLTTISLSNSITTIYPIVLDLSYNNLTSFNMNIGQFSSLDLSHNQISSLNIQNVQIGYVANFSNNNLSLLDLSNVNFYYQCVLYIGNNLVDKVLFGVTNQPQIHYTSDNTFFDLGNYSATNYCWADNSGYLSIENCPNLEYFILKNGYSHDFIQTCNEPTGETWSVEALSIGITNCPSLNFICVDEGERAFIQSRIDYLGLQDQVQVNSYCTFTPGGAYHAINGNVQFDLNANGCDPGDFLIPFQQFSITDGTETGTIISDESGNYTINVGPGTHTITPIVANPAGFAVSPTNVVVDFPAQGTAVVQNFCICASTPIDDFEITLVPVGPAIPGFNSNYKLIYKNTGNGVDDGTVTLTFQDDVLEFVSSSLAPAINNGGNIVWTFDSFIPFESRSIDLTFNLNSPMETPPLNSGDILSFSSSIGQTGAIMPFENNHILSQNVVNSFDPNDKTCLEGNTVAPEMVGEYVHYLI
ncbi:MAG TPA: hypothetical protein VGB43_07625, partial [Flavobacterium sp.]